MIPSEVKELIDSWFSDEAVIGFSCCIWSGSVPLVYICLGRADAETKRPVTPETRFRIASMTKSFAAAAILILRDEGRLSLSQTLGELLPDSRLDTEIKKIKVFDLLSMQSGLTTDDPWADRCLGYSDQQYDQVVSGTPFMPEPAEYRFQYSNLGYFLLGKILAAAAGCSPLEFITERLLLPLGLRHTAWNLEPGQEFAQGYARHEGSVEKQEIFHCRGYGDVFAGLWSTPQDLSVWSRFLAAAYIEEPSPFDRVLSKQSRQELQLGAALVPPRPPEKKSQKQRYTAYALGLHRRSCAEIWAAGHTGGLPGYGSHFCWSNEHQIGIAACANSTYAPAAELCIDVLERLIRDQPHAVKVIPRPLEQRKIQLLELIGRWKDQLAAEILAPNVLLDTPKANVQLKLRELAEVKERLSFRRINGSSGAFEIAGNKYLTISLEPLEPFRIQELKFPRRGI